MRIGVTPTPRESPTDLIRVARLAEERGIESIWLGEHSHLPVPTRHAFANETPNFTDAFPTPTSSSQQSRLLPKQFDWAPAFRCPPSTTR